MAARYSDKMNGLRESFDKIIYGPRHDLPEWVPQEGYEKAIDFLMSRWSLLSPRPLAIYQLGQVGRLGISDLDFIIVLQDERPIDWNQFQPGNFPGWVSRLFTHPPYCCTENTWHDLPAWFPVFNLRHLWGQTLSLPTIPERFVAGCSLGSLVDYLIVKMPRDVIWAVWETPIRIRILLAMLHSLKYTIKLAKQAKLHLDDEMNQFICKIDPFLTSWFDLEDSHRFESLTRLSYQACEVVGKLIFRVNEAITKEIHVSPIAQKDGYSENSSDLFYFISDWQFEKAFKLAFESYFKYAKIAWASPKRFLQVLSIYADECPSFGKFLKAQGCRLSLEWDGGIWNDGLRYHARAMTNYGNSISKLGVPPQKYIALNYEGQLSFFQRLIRYGYRMKNGKISSSEFAQRLLSQFYRSIKTS